MPVVALPGGSVPEIVVDGVTGFVCREAEELPAAIRKAELIEPLDCRVRAADHFDVGRRPRDTRTPTPRASSSLCFPTICPPPAEAPWELPRYNGAACAGAASSRGADHALA
jgi:hypothetical protein